VRCPRRIFPSFVPVFKKDAFNRKKLRHPKHLVPMEKLARNFPVEDLESDTELHNLSLTPTVHGGSPLTNMEEGLEDLEDLLPEHDAQSDSTLFNQ
jgi:hypothetical protein